MNASRRIARKHNIATETARRIQSRNIQPWKKRQAIDDLYIRLKAATNRQLSKMAHLVGVTSPSPMKPKRLSSMAVWAKGYIQRRRHA